LRGLPNRLIRGHIAPGYGLRYIDINDRSSPEISMEHVSDRIPLSAPDKSMTGIGLVPLNLAHARRARS
jgi:hypothetical protein